MYTASDACRHAGAPQVANLEEVLAVSFMTDVDVAEPARNWTTVAALKILVDTDAGATWKNNFQLLPEAGPVVKRQE